MQVSKEEGVAVCQEFGFATADGWSKTKLLRKVEELIVIYRSGEFEPKDDDVVAILDRLAEGQMAGKPLAIGNDKDWDEKAGEDDLDSRSEVEPKDDDDEIKARCLLSVGDRVIVSEEGVDSWKGIVDEIFSVDDVRIRDREGETWDTTVDKCDVKVRASEVDGEKKTVRSKVEKPEDEQEAEIRSLRERIRALNSRKSSSGEKTKRKKLRRDEIAVLVLKAHPEGGVLERLAEEVEEKWKRQGRQGNPQVSVSTLKRVVKVGVLFGLLKLEGRKVLWVVSKEGKDVGAIPQGE